MLDILEYSFYSISMCVEQMLKIKCDNKVDCYFFSMCNVYVTFVSWLLLLFWWLLMFFRYFASLSLFACAVRTAQCAHNKQFNCIKIKHMCNIMLMILIQVDIIFNNRLHLQSKLNTTLYIRKLINHHWRKFITKFAWVYSIFNGVWYYMYYWRWALSFFLSLFYFNIIIICYAYTAYNRIICNISLKNFKFTCAT